MSELPASWIKASLTEIAQVIMGQSPAGKDCNQDGDGLPFFQGKAEFRKIYPEIKKFCSVPKKIAEKNDILVSIRAPVGPTNLAPKKCCIGRGLAGIRTSSLGNQNYLLYFFKHIEPWLSQQGTGSTFKAINGDQIRGLVVSLAPLAEQTRIAAKLDELLAQVDTLKARIDGIPALLKRFRQSVLAAAVSGRLTEKWREHNSAHEFPAVMENLESFTWPRVQLGQVAHSFLYGSSNKSQPVGDIPVLRMGNIQNGRLVWDDLVFSSNKEEIKKYSLLVGDVLFNRTNSPELVGKTAIYKGEHPAIYAGYLIRVRCTERLKPDFLNYCLNSPQGRDYCWQVRTDGVSQSNINAKKLASFPFGLPSIEEQSEIVRRVEQLFAFADQLEARVKTTQTHIDRLTQSILAKAFRGELVPQDPNDEPASVLLDRIKAQRAAMPKPKRSRRTAKSS